MILSGALNEVGASDTVVRGRGVSYRVNGVEMNQRDRGSAIAVQDLEPSAFEQVEVVHGADAAFGFGFNGGSLSFATRRPTQGPPQFREDGLQLTGWGAVVGARDEGNNRCGVQTSVETPLAFLNGTPLEGAAVVYGVDCQDYEYFRTQIEGPLGQNGAPFPSVKEETWAGRDQARIPIGEDVVLTGGPIPSNLSYKEFNGRNQFDDVASDFRRRGRQGLGAVNQRERFRIERGDAGTHRDATLQHIAVARKGQTDGNDALLTAAPGPGRISFMTFQMTEQDGLPTDRRIRGHWRRSAFHGRHSGRARRRGQGGGRGRALYGRRLLLRLFRLYRFRFRNRRQNDLRSFDNGRDRGVFGRRRRFCYGFVSGFSGRGFHLFRTRRNVALRIRRGGQDRPDIDQDGGGRVGGRRACRTTVQDRRRHGQMKPRCEKKAETPPRPVMPARSAFCRQRKKHHGAVSFGAASSSPTRAILK